MTEELVGRGDPIIRRLQDAFAHEGPATELAAVMQRAARYHAGEPPPADDQPALPPGLTATDLAAARRREPAALTRIRTAYAPALYRYFMAAVGDWQEAEDLTGTTFASVIEGLPSFRGPVEALGGWLFRIARHDLDDYRRRRARSRIEPLEDNLGEAAAAADPEVLGKDTATGTMLAAVQAALDGEEVVPRARLDELVRRLADVGDRATDAPLNRLSPREREVLALLGRGWTIAQIGRELIISPYTVRIHVENMLLKVEMHARLEAATLAMQHGGSPAADDPQALAIGPLQGPPMTAALGQLPTDQREVLLLRMAAGLTAPEVAAVLGTTTGAVKALQHRGRANLARLLKLHHPDQPDDAPYPSPDLDHLS